jgi:hypothetical protein
MGLLRDDSARQIPKSQDKDNMLTIQARLFNLGQYSLVPILVLGVAIG